MYRYVYGDCRVIDLYHPLDYGPVANLWPLQVWHIRNAP